jgi:hypothetical protein
MLLPIADRMADEVAERLLLVLMNSVGQVKMLFLRSDGHLDELVACVLLEPSNLTSSALSC